MAGKKDDPYFFPPEAFVKEKPPEEERKEKLVKEYCLDPFDHYYVETYLKVGLFCGWSWDEYMNTPQWVVEYIDGEIDRRFLTNDFGDKSGKKVLNKDGKSPEPLNYIHSALILSLARLFAGDDKDKSRGRKR